MCSLSDRAQKGKMTTEMRSSNGDPGIRKGDRADLPERNTGTDFSGRKFGPLKSSVRLSLSVSFSFSFFRTGFLFVALLELTL